MRLAKPDEEDFDTTQEFLLLCESFWDRRQRNPFRHEESEWYSWDHDAPEYLECLSIRRRLAEEQDLREDEVDDRLIIYELLKRRYKKCDASWRRVIMTATVLLDNVCDPTLNYVEFHPGFECAHVAPEQ